MKSSNSNSNGKPHGVLNTMEYSTRDTIMLAEAVEQRFIAVGDDYLGKRGIALAPPESLNKAMLLWRQMRIRHRRGDMRNTRDELIATREIAQWTMTVQCALRNQPQQDIVWKD